MNIVLLGAPGSGKGTQATRISSRYDVKHISTGDIFRENIKNGTPLGVTAKGYIDQGHLCPDELTVAMVKERISRDDCAKGVLFDGFPRTIFQAQELDKFAKIDCVINLNVPSEKLIRRIVGRRSCLACGGTFHTDFIGETKTCPTCGQELYQRKDDNEETVKERIAVYEEQTKPLVNYYEEKGVLVNIDGDNDIEKIFTDIVKGIEK